MADLHTAGAPHPHSFIQGPADQLLLKFLRGSKGPVGPVLWEVLLDMGTWYGGGGAASLRLSSQPPRGQQWGVAAVNCPMRCSDLRLDSQKQRHPSGGVSVSSEMVFQLEGVELGADGKVGAGTMLSGGIGLMHVFWESRLKDVFD